MDIPLSDDKHLFVRDNSKKVHWKSETVSKTKYSRRQNSVQEKIREFFCDKIIFQRKFFSNKIFFKEFLLLLP